ncbi:MAG: type II CAAX endopeptidase family protein [Verrucomicrobiota bacterium]|nr:type II CAAX endopeptidase family protein [Verrucomicrobiota bacterium]
MNEKQRNYTHNFETREFTLEIDRKICWYRQATLIFVLAYILSVFFLFNLGEYFKTSSLFIRVLLSVVPMEFAGIGSIFLFLFYKVERGKRAEKLGLNEKGNKTSIVKRAAKRLLFVYPVSIAITLITLTMLNLFDYVPQGNPIMKIFSKATQPETIILLIILATIAAPICEEIIFRCIIFESFNFTLNKRISMILTSIIFASIHMVPEQIPALFFLAIILQKERNRTGNLYAAIAIHMLFNLTSLSLFILALILQK